jgi:uncharacterized protein (DUF2141 family)
MKNIIIFLTLMMSGGISFAQTNLILEIIGAQKDGGIIHLSLFNSEKSYEEKKAYRSLVSNPDTAIVLLTLPAGDYVISIYQDNNSNGKLDTNFIGIPKEMFGFSNYDGRGFPGNFNKHRIQVNDSTKNISVNLYKL